jgi:hypothetical protein
VDGVPASRFFPTNGAAAPKQQCQSATAGWNIRFAASLSSVQMLLFPFSIMVLRRVIVVVSSELRLVMLAMAIGSRFYRNISGHIVAAS